MNLNRESYTDEKLCNLILRFKRIFFWGLKDSHLSHRFIFEAYRNVFSRFKIDCFWVDDDDDSVEISRDDLIFVYGRANNLWKVVEASPYIIDFHVDPPAGNEFALDRGLVEAITKSPKRIGDREHTAFSNEQSVTVLDRLSFYCPRRRVLAQPWGTDYHPSEFLKPNPNVSSNLVVFNGTVWKSSWGNHDEIEELKRVCDSFGLDFSQVDNAKSAQNAMLVNSARLSPTVAGRGQVNANYLACRFFKNISYGQYCFTNIGAAREVLNENFLHYKDVRELENAMETYLTLTEKELTEKTLEQQLSVQKFTIYHHLYLCLLILLENS
ncbi:hypothetical protein [Aestuariibacter salexigens]|uniref:hypothetical protein n=1 Tax=Aestuariibacter salexigens TaxID=226010 RepID=UPI0004117064|nr:hypothetical protein [Aestuariibacter salexigens]